MEIVLVNPANLHIEENVRGETKIDSTFLSSIKSHGVLVPVIAIKDETGIVIVRDGQRRTLAAREAGLETIPAYISELQDEKSIRIIQQLVVNEHRAELDNTERVRAYKQLALEGLTVATIAKKTNAKRSTIEQSLKISESSTAITALENDP